MTLGARSDDASPSGALPAACSPLRSLERMLTSMRPAESDSASSASDDSTGGRGESATGAAAIGDQAFLDWVQGAEGAAKVCAGGRRPLPSHHRSALSTLTPAAQTLDPYTPNSQVGAELRRLKKVAAARSIADIARSAEGQEGLMLALRELSRTDAAVRAQLAALLAAP